MINIVVAKSSRDREYVKLKPLALYRTSLLVVKKPISSIIHSELNSKVTDYATSNAPNNTQHAIMRAVLAHRITSSGESTTHQSCRPRPSTTEAVRPHTLWLEVEEEGEQSIHTQYKHQRWLEPCIGDGKTSGYTRSSGTSSAPL